MFRFAALLLALFHAVITVVPTPMWHALHGHDSEQCVGEQAETQAVAWHSHSHHQCSHSHGCVQTHTHSAKLPTGADQTPTREPCHENCQQCQLLAMHFVASAPIPPLVAEDSVAISDAFCASVYFPFSFRIHYGRAPPA